MASFSPNIWQTLRRSGLLPQTTDAFDERNPSGDLLPVLLDAWTDNAIGTSSDKRTPRIRSWLETQIESGAELTAGRF